MKKTISIVLVILLLFSFAACGSKKEEQGSSAPANRLEEIQKKGYIEIATEPYFAPYEFTDPSKTGDDQYLGADIELMKAIASEIGVDLKIVPLDFTAVLAGIASGKYDLAISAIAYSFERSESMNLSNVYEFSDTGYGFIVRSEDAEKYSSIDSLKDAVVCTQSGSVQEGIYRTYVEKCKDFKLADQMTDAYLLVSQGKADVCICSTDSAQLYAEANGGLVVPEFRFDVDPNMNGVVCAAPKKDTDELIEVANKVIKKCQDDGSLSKWFEEARKQAKELGVE